MRSMPAIKGFINLFKPPGLTSAGAVNRVKRYLPRGTKIGHAGTLDRFAEGVLLLLIGQATKLCEKMMGETKEYEAVIKLGYTTPTSDPDTPETPWDAGAPDRAAALSPQRIHDALRPFIGLIQQTPPLFSALKVGGMRASDRTRAGEQLDLPPRPVRIDGIDILDFSNRLLKIRVACGRGTYIRALARDLGEALNVGGYLLNLRRTRVGDFRVENAVTIELIQQDGIEPHLRPLPESAR